MKWIVYANVVSGGIARFSKRYVALLENFISKTILARPIRHKTG